MRKGSSVFFLLLLFIPLTFLHAEEPEKTDSLDLVVRNSQNPAEVIDALGRMAKMNRDKPMEVYYLTAMLNKSLAVDSVTFVYDALSNLSRYYYNATNTDSLIFWTNYLDSLSTVRKDNPDAYYDAHSFISKQFLYDGDYELSVDEAVRLQGRAKESKQMYGRICASETLGTIYQVGGRDSLAAISFKEALDLLELTNGDLQYRIYILSNLIRVSLEAGQLNNAYEAWKMYNERISLQEAYNKEKQIVNNANWHRWMSYSFAVYYYLKKGDVSKATRYLNLTKDFAHQINREEKFNVAVFLYFYVQVLYNEEVAKYQLALDMTDSILDQFYDPGVVKHRIEMLAALQRYQEATSVYDSLVQSTGQQNSKVFVRQVEQLRTLHNVRDKNRQQHEVEISNIEMTQNQRALVLSICVFGLLLVFIYVLFLLVGRSKRLRKELEQEKQSLIDSQSDLYKAKVKAETASKMKSAFIANITHEIRTPLNAIVGFSSLLVDPNCEEEERKEYVDITQKNSDLLLNLVNDVLDLSHMESGLLVLSIQRCNLHTCCKEVLKSVKHRVAEGVKLTFSMPDETYELNTDPTRLKQLLINLLVNAAKFTKEGEINLAVRMDEEHKAVRFEVTDTGVGIPPEKQEKVFERFAKLNEYVQGAGLGLPICRMVAEQLGGSIAIDPTYTRGARFVFIHPSDIPLEQ